MNGSPELVSQFAQSFTADTSAVDVVFFPPAPLLLSLKASELECGAQNCYKCPSGAFTGEISPVLLKSVGVNWALIGHSERRSLFGEGDELIGEKVMAALEAGLKVVLCVGERLEERQSGQMESVLQKQLQSGIAPSLSLLNSSNFVLAYEPVWAIGTGQTASPQQAQSAHAFLRSQMARIVGEEVAGGVRIIYGGSVTAATAAVLMSEDVDGFLVGGASLKAQDFTKIVSSARQQ